MFKYESEKKKVVGEAGTRGLFQSLLTTVRMYCRRAAHDAQYEGKFSTAGY